MSIEDSVTRHALRSSAACATSGRVQRHKQPMCGGRRRGHAARRQKHRRSSCGSWWLTAGRRLSNWLGSGARSGAQMGTNSGGLMSACTNAGWQPRHGACALSAWSSWRSKFGPTRLITLHVSHFSADGVSGSSSSVDAAVSCSRLVCPTTNWSAVAWTCSAARPNPLADKSAPRWQ